MRNFVDDLSLKDRDVYHRWVGGLAGFCGALVIIMAGLLVDNRLSGNPPPEPAPPEAAVENQGYSSDAAMPAKQVAKDDWFLLRAPFARPARHRG